MVQVLFAFLAGVLTIAAPCILPMLPILLGASLGQKSKQRPLLIVLGFITSFAAASILLSAIVNNLGLSPNALRETAIAALAIFAIFMIWPKPFELLTLKLSGTINKAGQLGKGSGNMGGLILGFVLGIIWTPCAGPVLASILALIALQGNSLSSLILLGAYALGAGIPMLIIAYGSQYITAKVRFISQYSVRLQQIFGSLVFLLAVAMFFQYDILITEKLTSYFPQSNLEQKLTQSPSVSNSIESDTDNKNTSMLKLKNFGPAPEFAGIAKWLNLPEGKESLTLGELKGKVVLIDFWTYSCINCIRTMPYITKWYETYKDKGFVIVGVHTPEFAFEKVPENVKTAVVRFGINYPVAQDNDFKTWSAYNNQYWPAHYLIDKEGNIRYTHFGEGNYKETEDAIQQLLEVSAENVSPESAPKMGRVNSPEMYFGLNRLEHLSDAQSPAPKMESFTFPASLSLNTFALEGLWQFNNDNILSHSSGKIRLKFSSGKVFMVASSKTPQTLKIIVDGKPQKDVTVQFSQLYNLFESNEYKEHIIDIEIPEAELEAFTFTFG